MAEIKDGKMKWESPVLVRFGGADEAVGQCEPAGSGVFLSPCIQFGVAYGNFRVVCEPFGAGLLNNAH